MNPPPQPADVNEFDVGYAYRTMFILVGFNFMILYIEGMLTPSLPSIAAGFGSTGLKNRKGPRHTLIARRVENGHGYKERGQTSF